MDNNSIIIFATVAIVLSLIMIAYKGNKLRSYKTIKERNNIQRDILIFTGLGTLYTILLMLKAIETNL
jgi:amino acid transporter